MSKLRIHFVLPSPSTKPGGGTRVLYEYANRLSLRGHEVHIYHSIVKPFRFMRSPVWFKWMMSTITNYLKPCWFKFNPTVKRHIVPDITDRYLADSDIVIGTWWEMAYRINDLSPQKGIKFNLIQDTELWTGHEKLVKESYNLPINHLVIARYLQDLVSETSGIQPILLPNAIDREKFKLIRPIEQRKINTVIMLYSDELRKGSQYGLKALQQLKKEVKDLRVTLFSTFPKPSDLPEWITFYKQPQNLPELYNQSNIFLSPSLGEGWALPPAEAMSCGCAVVCTAIGGHADYAFDEQTALLVKPASAEEIEQQILRLLNDDELRKSIANKGNEFITQNYHWDKSVDQLEEIFLKAK